jgi:hypothetical protein
MSNCVVVVKCGTGGRRGETEKEKGELVRPRFMLAELKAAPGKSERLGPVPGFGSLKLVKTAWGTPGDEEVPPPNWK